MSAHLENFNYSAYQYQLAMQQKLEEICEPLFNLGIKYFTYGIFFETGKYLYVGNHEEFARYHFSIKRVGDMWLKVLSEVQGKRYFLLPYDKKDQDQIINFASYVGFWNGFCIYKRKPGYVTVHSFGTDTNDLLFSQFYFKNISLLERFCDYFNDKGKDIIDYTDKTKLAILEHKINFSTALQEDLSAKKVQQFLQEIFNVKRNLKIGEEDIQLSKREIECLHFLSLGKTMKEIAKILDLSPRSVEFYLQSIKKKSGLKRGELIAHFSHNFTASH